MYESINFGFHYILEKGGISKVDIEMVKYRDHKLEHFLSKKYGRLICRN